MSGSAAEPGRNRHHRNRDPGLRGQRPIGDRVPGRARAMLFAVGAALVAGGAGAACGAPSDSEGDAEVDGPLTVVQGHMDAFNRHDAEDLLAWVSPAVEWVNVQGSITSVEVRGREMLRDYMATYFEAQPTVRSEIEDTMVTGDFVAVRERASWTAPDGEARSQASLAVYHVRDGLIQRVWYYPVVP